jgi:hypothetical protein
MRNALNKLADTVEEPAAKKVSKPPLDTPNGQPCHDMLVGLA